MNSERKLKTGNLLSICIKAGKTVKGFDSVCEGVKNGEVLCVLTASDASAKTVKEINFVCDKYSIPVLESELSKEEIGKLCRKETAVIGICDKGFSDGFAKIIVNNN